MGVAEKDTKDASSGVMKDLRRFQAEKEDDLRRYMVSLLSLVDPIGIPQPNNRRWSLRNVISTGRNGTRLHGKKHGLKSITSPSRPKSTKGASRSCDGLVIIKKDIAATSLAEHIACQNGRTSE